MELINFCVFAANLSAIAVGTCLGWTSSAESKMRDMTQSPLARVPTTEEFSWISSLVALGALIGPYIAGVWLKTLIKNNNKINEIILSQGH